MDRFVIGAAALVSRSVAEGVGKNLDVSRGRNPSLGELGEALFR